MSCDSIQLFLLVYTKFKMKHSMCMHFFCFFLSTIISYYHLRKFFFFLWKFIGNSSGEERSFKKLKEFMKLHIFNFQRSGQGNPKQLSFLDSVEIFFWNNAIFLERKSSKLH